MRRLSISLVLAVAAIPLVGSGVAAGGGCHPDPGMDPSASSKPFVTIDECAFVDTVTYVEPNETVTWVNKDVVPHTVTGAALAWGNEEYFDQGIEVSYRFEKEGVYPYYCALHPSMVGAVVVGDGRGQGAGSVEPSDVGAAAAAREVTPVESEDGASPAVVALAVTAALGAVLLAARYALGRRAGAVPAP